MTRWLAIVTIAACGGHGKVAPDAQGLVDAAADGAAPTPDGAPDAMPDAIPDAATPVAVNARLAVGGDTSCVIHTDGTLWCWGSPTSNVATAVAVPTQVGTGTSWTAITAGYQHAFGIAGGALYAWGTNYSNTIGTGDNATYIYATPTQLGSATDWTTVSEGAQHACAIRAGALYCWGSSTNGEAGSGSTITTPAQLGTDTDWIAVAAGYEMTCGLRGTAQARTLWCWGFNEYGALGNGVQTPSTMPVQIGTDTDWSSVVANPLRGQACAHKLDGSAWCWGEGFQMTPTQLATDAPSIGLGNVECYVHGGTLTCRGQNLYESAGVGNGSQLPSSTFVDLPGTWKAVAAHVDHACAIDANDHISCWGGNGYGKLGIGTMPDRAADTRLGTQTWSAIGMTSFYNLTCGLSGGSIYCWGGPGDGNAPLGQQTPHLIGSSFIDMKVGFDGGCARKADHSLWCWGDGSYFGGANTLTPVQIGTATDWDDYAVDEMTCGIRAGALYCWGPNYYGEVGDGTTTTRTAPVQIGTDTTWTAIATNQFDTCGVDAGTLYCWGYRVNSKTPKAVTNGGSWLTIAMDTGGYACGLRTNHSVSCAVNGSAGAPGTVTDWAWTDTQYSVKTSGALYDGGTQVGTATDWVSVTETAFDRCGLHSDGSLTCMGQGHAGELGNGDAWVLVPTQTQ